MCFVEKYLNLRNVIFTIPLSSDGRIDDSMPDFYITRLISFFRKNILLYLRIIDKMFLIKINIRIETWKRRIFLFYYRNRHISDENRPNKGGNSLLSISIIIEFFILCCYRLRRSIFWNHKKRYACWSKITLYIRTILFDFWLEAAIRISIYDNRNKIMIILCGSICAIKKRNLYCLCKK